MKKPDSVNHSLNNLKMRLDQVNRAWTVDDHEALLMFYVRIVPRIMGAERCSIFVVEPGSEKIWLKYGTGLKEKDIMPPGKGTVVGDAISSGACIILNDIRDRTDYHEEVESKTGFITRNLICAPIKSLTGQGITGAVQVLNKQEGHQFTSEDGELLKEVANYISMALEKIVLSNEILHISNQLNTEIDQLWKEDIEFVAESPVMKNILDTVKVISTSPVNVLIQGESGTGKEVIARMIHKGRFLKISLRVNFLDMKKGRLPARSQAERDVLKRQTEGFFFLMKLERCPWSCSQNFYGPFRRVSAAGLAAINLSALI
jgi:transcriptional regulator with GAF, ATPase, and Fis domain